MRPGEIGPVPEETAAAVRQAMPEGCLAVWLRDALAGLYRDADFAGLFPARGQPAVAPWRLAVVTVLQFAEGLTDRQAAQAVCLRLDWKYALGLRPGERGFDFSVLSAFRGRLLAGGAAERLLERLLACAVERGWLRAGGRQRTDSTHVLAAIRTLNRLQLAGETLRQALEHLAVLDPAWLRACLTPDWVDRYARRFDSGRLPRAAAEQARLAEAVGADGLALLAALDQAAAPPGAATLPAVAILRRVWWQQYYAPDERGRARWRRPEDLPPAGVAIHSPYDPEARYSRKRGTTWVGYKVHLTEVADAAGPHLITHVATSAGTVADRDRTAAIQRALAAKGLAPAEHLVDEGYTDAALLVTSAERGIALTGPLRRDNSPQARAGEGFALAAFGVDWAAHRVTCPNGRPSAGWTPGRSADGEPIIRVTFAGPDCRACPVRAACTAADGPRRLTLRPRAEHEALQAARARQQTPAFQAAYAARAGVEGTIAQATGAFAARTTRYRSLAKTHLQQVATAVAINLVRLRAYLQDPRPFTPHRSAFASLFQIASPCPT